MNENASDVAKKQHSTVKRLRELDVLRGIAAIGVLACHYASECVELGQLQEDFRWGSYGPHLFFLISGFVILMTIDKRPRPRDFVFSRFSRLYPVYWFGVLFSATIVLLNPAHFESAVTVPQVLGNLTMGQTWLKIPDIEVSYWTLSVELKFYALMFLLLLFPRRPRIEALVVTWLAVVVGYHLADLIMGLPHVLGTPLIVNQAHLFAAGMMFFRLRQDGHHWLRHVIILAAIPLQYALEGMESAVLVAMFVMIFYLFVSDRLRWIALRPLTFLGDISYAMYLIHGALGVVVIHALHHRGVHVVGLIMIPMVLSISLATLLTRHVEQPTLRMLRNWYAGERPEQGRAHAGVDARKAV